MRTYKITMNDGYACKVKFPGADNAEEVMHWLNTHSSASTLFISVGNSKVINVRYIKRVKKVWEFPSLTWRQWLSLSGLLFVVLTIIVIFCLSGCSIPEQPITQPPKMPDGKWVSCSWFHNDCGGAISNLGRFETGVGVMNQKLNSDAYKHERYYQFMFREPALSPEEFQINKKVKSYILGKYGVLP